jgi:hypothetical protein
VLKSVSVSQPKMTLRPSFLNHAIISVIFAVLATAGILNFYYDGPIWASAILLTLVGWECLKEYTLKIEIFRDRIQLLVLGRIKWTASLDEIELRKSRGGDIPILPCIAVYNKLSGVHFGDILYTKLNQDDVHRMKEFFKSINIPVLQVA